MIEADAVFQLVIDDAVGFHPPHRRALAGRAADLAGRIGGVERFGQPSARAPRAGGGKPPRLSDQRAETLECAVAHLVG